MYRLKRIKLVKLIQKARSNKRNQIILVDQKKVHDRICRTPCREREKRMKENKMTKPDQEATNS